MSQNKINILILDYIEGCQIALAYKDNMRNGYVGSADSYNTQIKRNNQKRYELQSLIVQQGKESTTPENQELIIEVGKYYKNRKGEKFLVVFDKRECGYYGSFPFICVSCEHGYDWDLTEEGCYYTEEQQVSDMSSDMDLVDYWRDE